MSEDTKLKELIINTLSPEQFEPITPSDTEIYLVEDDAEYATVEELATKQDTLVSGTNIKTINGNSLLGSGNINIPGGPGGDVSWDDVQDKPDFANVATSGSYYDLVDTPAFALVAESGSYNDLFDTPDFASVATSGSYNDLSDTPTSLSDIEDLSSVSLTNFNNDLSEFDSISIASHGNIINDGELHQNGISDFMEYVRFERDVDFDSGQTVDFEGTVNLSDEVNFSGDVDFSSATVTGLSGRNYYLELDDVRIVAWKLPDGGYYCEQSAITDNNVPIWLPIPYSDDTYDIQLTPPSYVNAEDMGVYVYGIYEQRYDSFNIVSDKSTSPGGRGVHWKTSGYTTEDIGELS